MPEDKLDKIPDSLALHMSLEMEKGTKEGDSPLDAIMKAKSPKKTLAGKKPSILDLDGFHIYNEPMSLMLFRLVQLKNLSVDQILTEAKFNMADISGKHIFPRPNDPTPKS